MQGLKILIHMGFGTLSHVKPLLETGLILQERNHTVMYAAVDSYEKFNQPYNFTFISLGELAAVGGDMRARMKQMFSSRKEADSFSMPKSFGQIAPKSYDALYPAVSKVLERERPDVVLCDFFSAAGRDAADMHGIPLITGFQTIDGFGIVTSPFVTSNMNYGPITTQELSFYQRFQDKFVNPLMFQYYFRDMIRALNLVREKYGVPPATQPFGDFSTSLGLANTFIGLEAATNVPPHIKLIGPIHSNKYTPLSKDLKQFLDVHERTIYIAFGSAVALAEFDLENLVVASLAALQEGSIDAVLWGLGKTLKEDFPDSFTINSTQVSRDQLFSHPQIRLLDWAPQTAILHHENTRLFISHGGIESSFESILAGTPILCMAFFGDQPRNARKLEDAGIGKYVNRISINPASLQSEIRAMIQDSTGSIRVNSLRMKTIAQMGGRRITAGADAVEEYAYTAKICRPRQNYSYGDIPCELSHLTMASRKMNFFQANLLDVYAFTLISVLASVGLVGYGLIRLLTMLFKPSHATTDKSKKD